jgi:hypothetical protein
MLEEDKVKIQREKDQLLMEQTVVKEAVNKSLRSVPGLAQEEQESVEIQVVKLAEAIQQLQARIMELEIQAVPSTRRRCAIRGRKPLRMHSWKDQSPHLRMQTTE